jgi:hypothetical protein
MESIKCFTDHAIYEQIVILFPPCKVLSKEDGGRLNE